MTNQNESKYKNYFNGGSVFSVEAKMFTERFRPDRRWWVTAQRRSGRSIRPSVVRGNEEDQTAGRSRKSRGADRRRSRTAGGEDQTASVRCSRSERRNFKKILQTTVVQEDEHTLISVNVVT
ncbi:Uncharacterized protein Fot_41595 [Forsythia ovata]|uniref:Uncharacterized protein n=1 Tax=Forsythia ovata TaxID=205694 RepID=A0ABD1RKH2_9LAMI